MNGSLRIGLITTLDTNIGDDFIREGIVNVLRSAFPNRELSFVAVNKHQPSDAYPPWHPIRLAARLPRGRARVGRVVRRATSRFGMSLFDNCDLVVQCGAPVLWPGCHRSEWAEPLWHEIVGRIFTRTAVLNLAAGACFPWERQPVGPWDEADSVFLRSTLRYCRVTTARDRLARDLYAALGSAVPFIPCSALVAPRTGKGGSNPTTVRPRSPNGARPVILVNYMRGGGHYDWDQQLDAEAWERTMGALLADLKRSATVMLLCHNDAELREAEKLDSSLPRLRPNTVREYFDVVASADAGVCNRMHASVAMAGLGIPSVAIGTDTRLLMVDALGLPNVYVKDATAELLRHLLDERLTARTHEAERLAVIGDETWAAYRDAVLASC